MEKDLSAPPPYEPSPSHNNFPPDTALGTLPPPYSYEEGHDPVRAVPVPVGVTRVVYPLALGPGPVRMQCPNCRSYILTSTVAEPGAIAYLAGVVLCLLGCWMGCCLIPCFMDSLKEVSHSCPNCKCHIGTFRP